MYGVKNFFKKIKNLFNLSIDIPLLLYIIIYRGDLMAIRSCWFTFILYPDNPYHVKLLDYLKSRSETSDCVYSFMYICHEPDGDEEPKAHYHVLLHSSYPKTAGGVRKSLGEVWGYKTDVDGKVIYLPDISRIPQPDDDKKKVFVVSKVLICEDPEGLCRYMTHDDFNSSLLGKKRYDISDIKKFGNLKLLDKLFCSNNPRARLYNDLQAYTSVNRLSDLISVLLADNRSDLVDYISHHAYFVKTFFIKGGDN